MKDLQHMFSLFVTEQICLCNFFLVQFHSCPHFSILPSPSLHLPRPLRSHGNWNRRIDGAWFYVRGDGGGDGGGGDGGGGVRRQFR